MTAGVFAEVEPARRAAGGCPPDDTFTRLIEGALADDQVRRLQAHGDACARCSRTLTELARAIAPDPGDWLGDRYRLLEPLGAGGMGVVSTAFDTKLQRRVAVKRLRDPGAGAGGGASAGGDAGAGGGPAAERRRARFLREARLLASLSHPNVLTVHDVGGNDRELYVVMELVDGWPMSRWRSETQPAPGWRDIVDLYVQVGRGLSAAHRLDVVHRDVKPENILVARSGRVLIGDFGLAGLADAGERAGAPAGEPGAGLTQTGAVLGTPAYMAPELHDGKPADASSDQFSFCVSLYESLHGRRPFAGETAREIAAAARAGRLRPGGDGVPRAIDRVLARGLAAAPGARHASMDALVAALEGARDRRAAGRPRAAVAAAGLAALLVAGAAGGMLARQPGEESAGASVGTGTRTATRTRTGEGAWVRPEASGSAPVVPVKREVASMSPPSRPPARAPRRTAAAAPRPAAPRALARAEGVVAPPAALPPPGASEPADPRLLLFLADGAHAERDGAACLVALDRLPAGAWPPALAEHAQRRRATCEMLRGACVEGQRLLQPLDGADGARAALLDDCPPGALGTVEDRLLAVATQADGARYAGNPPARRKDLRQLLLRQAASAEVQACVHDRGGHGCGRRLAVLSRAYQVLAESFLAGGDCREGALLDVAQSQLRFQSLEPEGSDPALGCRAQRTSDVYPSCAPAADEAERACVARVRATRPLSPTLSPPGGEREK